MALPPLNLWLGSVYSEAVSKRAGRRVSAQEVWRAAAGRDTL